MIRPLLFRRWLCPVLVCSALLAAGCAQQRIRDESDGQMREQRYEAAIDTLESGLKQHPDSALLRAGLIQTRNDALLRLVAEATRERAVGRLDEAEALLRRAERFDTGGKRVTGLLAELSIERRQRDALAKAEALAAQQPQAALKLIADALKDNPRQPELLALQRRLAGEQRRKQVRAAQVGLAEMRPIALDFRDAGLRTVLDVVTRNSGINFILDKDIRQDVRVTVFLRSARVEDAIDLIVSTHQLAKKVLDEKTILIFPNTPDKLREYQEQVVRVFHLVSADAKGAAAFLRAMLKVREPFVDERSNMVAIREPVETIELAERLIALYDTNEAEVLLELEVLEVRSTRLTDLGIQFPDTLGLTPLNPSGGAGGLTVGNLRGFNENRVGVSVAGLLLNFKREVGDFNTLANPRIRVHSKEKAKVLIGDKVPVVTATTGQGGFVADSVSYLDVGLKLDVEPTVFADDEVSIKINLEVSSLTREVRTTSGSLAYQIGTRTASTLLRLRDGETQLLAGLISKDERSSSNRVPGLGDLPVAGRLFSSQRDESNRTELVLAVTPRVLRNLRRPDASEAELWVGTESMPRIRPVGGLVIGRADAAQPNGAAASAEAPGPAAALPMPGPAAAPEARATLRWTGPSEVKAGDTFVVNLELDSPVALRGAPMQLRFSAANLQLVDIEEGPYFRSDGATTSFTKATDLAQGTARAGVLRNQATGARGQGSVLQLRLRATAAGAGEVALMNFEPVALGEPSPRLQLPASLRVTVK
jgi:general secretion pathway protein D